MESHIGNIMTLSNSIIGVSILAMPFCFKQCGIVLAILMLLISSVVTRLTCHFLLKSAIMARRRTFELLAFHTFGTTGKFMVELGIIGFLMGTCIAFFVIIGDLGPAIVAKILSTKPTSTLRISILIGVAVFCVLPLGLLKNVDSLHNVSTATIGFYICLILKTISEATTHFLSGDWLNKVELWRPVGILQCLPIFAMALACQTQLFEIYETVTNPTLDKMNYIIRSSVNICVAVYVSVGFFGYAAFASEPFTGNILMSFSPSIATDVMKIGFVLSVAFSFPLVIFPCRASLNSLLFKKGYAPYEGHTSNYIPESRFKLMTIAIIITSLIIGILIPNIEVVLGLLGSTIGTMICLIFPVTCFICVSTKNTNERLLAQIMLFIGVIIMVMGTYANLYAMETINDNKMITEKGPIMINNIIDIKKEVINIPLEEKFAPIEQVVPVNEVNIIKKEEINKLPEELKMPVVVNEQPKEIRLEPPQPVEPQEIKEKSPEKVEIKTIPPETLVPKLEVKPDFVEVKKGDIIKEDNKAILEVKQENPVIVEPQKIEEKKSKIKEVKTVEEVDIEAIKKEDKEIQEVEKMNKNTEVENEKELLKKLEEHKQEQKSLIKEQLKLLNEIKKEKAELKEQQQQEKEVENEARRKAASEIIEIAKKAIEVLAPKDEIPKQKIEDTKIEDPIIKQLQDISNNTKEKKKSPTDGLIPLPMAVNKTINEILKETQDIAVKKEVIQDDKIVNKPKEVLPNILLLNKDKIKLLPSIKTEVKEVKLEEKISEDNNNNLSKNLQDKMKKDIQKNNEIIVDESIKQRDILTNNESTENTVSLRVKRNVNLTDNTEKCERKDKIKILVTESPFVKLITDLSKTDIFKFEPNTLMENFQSQIKESARLNK